ncbi:unnamed protein product [Rotaria sordida]|uniref:Uncharacterized protein n=1 Tax=Rotaria sordida TaxID=392033 RepID=A0A819DGZ9_9BILA|nr:unnamed protein product [Rotaria sordida]CAF3823691.1 unnamed protein product [Rotaria sordida]
MGNKIAHRRSSIATSTTVISTDLTSFVYDDLIFHVQAIQNQMIEIVKYLDDRWKNEKKIRKEIKSRSIIIIDPYGNPMTDTYMDHELISTLFRKWHLEDSRTLSAYNIQKEAVLYMSVCLRGGMYHFTSGRLDFENLPKAEVKVIKNILAFKFKHKSRPAHLLPVKLQNFVLQGQLLLSKLFNEFKNVYTSDDVPYLKNMILPDIADNEDDDDFSNAQ